MEMRTLGRTGVKVSPLCLGAMMFGQWGNHDHDDSIRIIHAALADEAGIPLIEIAIAFVLNHPAISAAIIGPRTMEHLESQLGAVSYTHLTLPTNSRV